MLSCLREQNHARHCRPQLLANAERAPQVGAPRWRSFPRSAEAVRSTRRIARVASSPSDLGYRFPEYPLPCGQTPIGVLRELTEAGARERWGRSAEGAPQLEHELAVIGKLELAGYFLIAGTSSASAASRRSSPWPRSAANSAVCYALLITAVDAVGMELLLRSVSSPRSAASGRTSTSTCERRPAGARDPVRYQRYGERGAAMTANVITYRTRSAVREVARRSASRPSAGRQALENCSTASNSATTWTSLPLSCARRRSTRRRRASRCSSISSSRADLPRHLGQHSGGHGDRRRPAGRVRAARAGDDAVARRRAVGKDTAPILVSSKVDLLASA